MCPESQEVLRQRQISAPPTSSSQKLRLRILFSAQGSKRSQWRVYLQDAEAAFKSQSH